MEAGWLFQQNGIVILTVSNPDLVTLVILRQDFQILTWQRNNFLRVYFLPYHVQEAWEMLVSKAVARANEEKNAEKI